MRPERRLATFVLALALVVSVVGCSRVTFLRPDVSRGDFRRTAPEVQIRTDSGGRTSAVALTRVAEARLVAGDAQAAAEAARRAVRADAGFPEAHGVLALSLEALGRDVEAGAHHRRAAELAPAQGVLLSNYGSWLCTHGRAPEAMTWFERAAAAPGQAAAHGALANAGACAVRAGQLDHADAYLRKAIALAPSDPVALQALAELELGRGRALQARAFIERRLAAAPADERSLQLASQIEQRLGDSAAAARYVQRIRVEFPRTSDSAREGGNR